MPVLAKQFHPELKRWRRAVALSFTDPWDQVWEPAKMNKTRSSSSSEPLGKKRAVSRGWKLDSEVLRHKSESSRWSALGPVISKAMSIVSGSKASLWSQMRSKTWGQLGGLKKVGTPSSLTRAKPQAQRSLMNAKQEDHLCLPADPKRSSVNWNHLE